MEVGWLTFTLLRRDNDKKLYFVLSRSNCPLIIQALNILRQIVSAIIALVVLIKVMDRYVNFFPLKHLPKYIYIRNFSIWLYRIRQFFLRKDKSLSLFVLMPFYRDDQACIRFGNISQTICKFKPVCAIKRFSLTNISWNYAFVDISI